MTEQVEETALTVVSGIKFPTDSRQYLMNLVRDVVKHDDSKFLIVAGHIIDGEALAGELRGQLIFEAALLRNKEREARRQHKIAQAQAKADMAERGEKFVPEPFDETPFRFERGKFAEEFIQQTAQDLNDFLPRIKGANYHIVVAQKVYDKDIGVSILELLREMRDDVRLLGGDKRDGKYDAEVKVPLLTKGFEEIRVLVPQRKPWFYEMITGLMQRLINSFVARTFSGKPSLLVIGCTGTGAYLPFYKGVPAISVPVLHKLNEQTSTENMVGCVTVKIVPDGDRFRIIPRVYDFRPIVAKERELLIPKGITDIEKMIVRALRISAASLGTLIFRTRNAQNGRNGRQLDISEEKIQEALKNLANRGIVTYRKKSNHWAINEEGVGNINITLKDLLKNTRTVRHAAISCVHIGALKTLYRTLLYHFPSRAADVDAIIDNGDPVQGLAHNYEYNGELLPIANGFDKQRVLAARLTKKRLCDIFLIKLTSMKRTASTTPREILETCLPVYIINAGNHLDWLYYQKHAYRLYDLVRELNHDLVEALLIVCQQYGIQADYWLVKEVVDKKILVIVENHLVGIDGALTGVKHPSKSRTKTKSHRIQDVVEFLSLTHEQLRRYRKDVPKDGFGLSYVANFHEAALVLVVRFSRTIAGIMTGAYLKDTQFEAKQDKVVDHGFALVNACLDSKGQLVYIDTEFDNFIHPKDAKLVFADKIDTSDVLRLCEELTKITDLPWRI